MATLKENMEAIKLEKDTKILPENLKSGITAFGVEGNLREGGADIPVKLFETIEEMQADTNPEEGDLALVYRNEISNATVDSHFQTATFPDTVVLDNAITDYVEVRYRAVDSSKMFDCWGSLDSSMFMMDCYTESGSIRIQYTSSDGITYTRTDTTGNPVDFGTEIYYERPEMWNDAIGKFIQIGGSTFEGLYQSQSIKVKNTYILDNNRIKIAQYDNFNDSQYALMIKHKFSENEISEYTLLTMNKYIYPFIDSNNKLWVYNSNLTTSLEEYSVNAESYSSRSIIAKTSISNGAIVNNITDIGITVDLDSCIPLGNPLYSGDSTDVVKTIDELTKIKDISTIEPEQVYELKYLPALTQLSATSDYVYEKEFYGKNGVEIGTLQNKENLTKDEAKRRVDIWSNYNSGIVCPEDMTQCFKDMTISTIPLLDTSKVAIMRDMLYNCTNLTKIPLLDTSNVTDMNGLFYECTNLIEVPQLDTSNVTNMGIAFASCTSLTTVPQLDTSNVTSLRNTFHSCTSLSDESLNNILAMCTNATSYTRTKTLEELGLTSEQATKCTTLSNYSAFTSAGWTTGY